MYIPLMFDTCPGKPHCSRFVQPLGRSIVNVKSHCISHRSGENVSVSLVEK